MSEEYRSSGGDAAAPTPEEITMNDSRTETMMPNGHAADSEQDTAFDALRLQFVAEWEAGRGPSLEDYAARYPEHALALTDFVLGFFALESAAARTEEPTAPSETALRAVHRARAALNLPPLSITATEEEQSAVTTAAPLTLAEARKAKDWTPAELARQLRLPNIVVVRLERGQISQWPRLLERRLAEALDLTSRKVSELLAATVDAASSGGGGGRLMEAAAHYSAQGGAPQTGLPPARSRTFAEALAESHLSEEQRAYWDIADDDEDAFPAAAGR